MLVISTYECVGQLKNGDLVHISFGQTGIPLLKTLGSVNTDKYPIVSGFTDTYWSVFRIQPIENYVKELQWKLKCEMKDKEQKEKLELAFGIVSAVIAIVFPASI
jgi:hypothetical protein